MQKINFDKHYEEQCKKAFIWWQKSSTPFEFEIFNLLLLIVQGNDIPIEVVIGS